MSRYGNNKGLSYDVNQDTLKLRRAKSDCEAALTEAIINENREELIQLTSTYYDILVALEIQRRAAYNKKKNSYRKVKEQC